MLRVVNGRALFRRWAGLPLALAVLPVALAAVGTTDYRSEIQAWRDARETRLKGDDGWLTVAGLFWLKEGPNRFGSAKDNDIVLPAAAPAHAGVFEFKAGKTTARLNDDAHATAEGKPVTTLEMRADTSGGEPEVLTIGHLRMFIIERGGRYGVRLKDSDSERRKNFTGLRWFPISESYRVTARFVPVNPPAKIAIPNILGQVSDLPSPGYAVFNLNGQELRLDPVLEEPDAEELFFIFRDGTSGKETYGAGRFLYTEKPHDGTVVLDFNKAFTPPCAFTPFATCPLPPKQNRLSVRIEAGEMSEAGH